MATPLRHIVDDVATDLNQLDDDRKITKAQVAYWVIVVANRLRSQHIGKRDSGAFLTTFDNVPIEIKDASSENEIKNRKFFILPKTIYDYDMDGGIEYISFCLDEDKPGCPPAFTNVTFSRTTPGKSRRLYYSPYEKPCPSNPYFYRVHDHIYLLGIECVDISSVEVGVYSAIDPVTKIDLDAPFDFPEELIITLKRQVLDLGRFALLIPQERVNDGSNDVGNQGVPTNKLVSVNELNEDQTQNK